MMRLSFYKNKEKKGQGEGGGTNPNQNEVKGTQSGGGGERLSDTTRERESEPSSSTPLPYHCALFCSGTSAALVYCEFRNAVPRERLIVFCVCSSAFRSRARIGMRCHHHQQHQTSSNLLTSPRFVCARQGGPSPRCCCLGIQGMSLPSSICPRSNPY